MLGVFILQIVVYVFFYDKSYYHIDTVREPMIRFLFFQAMLLGVRFRMYKEDYLNTNKKLDWVWLCFALLIYFLSKLAFSRLDTISHYQLLNHITIFISLYFVMKCFAGIEQKLQGLPEKLKAVITKIAQITLEIYMVQFVIIRCFAKLSFPGNWFLITSLIFTCALCLQTLTNFTKSIFEKMYFFFFPKHKTEP
jgi:peptidoglycan/LPS O-acetylase OafA/YrhL